MIDPLQIPTGTGLVDHLRDLPQSVHMVAVVALLAGLVLWLAGRRVIRFGLVLVGAAVGAGIGVLVLPLTAIAGVISPYVALGAGGAVGAAAGFLAYRFAMAVSLAAVLALGMPIGAAALLAARGTDAPSRALEPDQLLLRGVPLKDAPGAHAGELPGDLAEEMRRLYNDARETLNEAADPLVASRPPANAFPGFELSEEQQAAARAATDRIRAFGAALWDEFAAAWSALPARDRFILTAATVGGAALGVAIGALVPGWAAGVVTALFGSAVWLGAGAWLCVALDAPGQEHLVQPARTWLLVWGAVSAIGMIVQWALLRRVVRRSVAPPAPGAP